jgi:excisionase family DNA binding protein
MTRLLTAEQVCAEYGIPLPRTLRTMRQRGLPAMKLGKAYLFDSADVEAFIQAAKTWGIIYLTPEMG